MENYYEILGVSENATQDEIKKAFRNKSKVMHPDKGGNEEDFKKISEAYDTIGDENKRAQYDQQKNNPFGDMGGNPFDIFSQMFGGFSQRQRKVPDMVVEVEVGVIDSFLGKNIEVNFNRKTKCEPCNSKGGDRVVCNICKGTGQITQQVGNSFFSNIFRTNCNSCSGRGFNFSNVCNVCHGEGKNTENVKLNLNLPKGISDGQFIKAGGYGNFHDNMYGDAILKINIVPQNGFEKNGNDLIYNKFLSISDFSNDKISIPHPNGELNITFPNEIDTSKPLRVRGKGFEGGDLYINMFVKHSRLN